MHSLRVGYEENFNEFSPRAEIITRLIASGADPKKTDLHNKTCLQVRNYALVKFVKKQESNAKVCSVLCSSYFTVFFDSVTQPVGLIGRVKSLFVAPPYDSELAARVASLLSNPTCTFEGLYEEFLLFDRKAAHYNKYVSLYLFYCIKTRFHSIPPHYCSRSESRFPDDRRQTCSRLAALSVSLPAPSTLVFACIYAFLKLYQYVFPLSDSCLS